MDILEDSENSCSNCGESNPDNSNYCSNCGHRVGTSEISGPDQDDKTNLIVNYQPSIIGSSRILFLTFASWGLYFYYWVYITWKDLENEISDSHTPLLQTISMFIPIYQLFRFNRHVSIIRSVAIDAGLQTDLKPIVAVLLVALNGIIGYISLGIQSLIIFGGLLLLSLVLTATVINWAQETLNRYWVLGRSVASVEKRMQTGEWILCGLGTFVWINLLAALI